MTVQQEGPIVTIDLGEERWSPDSVPAHRYFRQWRTLLTAVFCVAAILTLTGSVPGVRPHSELLWSMRSGQFALIEDTIIIMSVPSRVSAREALTGRLLWEAGGPGYAVETTRVGERLVAVTWFQPPPGQYRPGSQASAVGSVESAPVDNTIVYDLDTGAVLTSLPGRLVWQGPGVLVYLHECRDVDFCVEVVGVATRTGAELWRRKTTSNAVQFATGATRYGVLDDHGHLSFFDLRTGEAAGAADAPDWRGPTLMDELGWPRTFFYLEDALYNARIGGVASDTATVTGRSLADGTTWTTTISLFAPLPGYESFLVFDNCATWVCVNDGAGTTILNRRTGQVVAVFPGPGPVQIAGLPLFVKDTSDFNGFKATIMRFGSGFTGVTLDGAVISIDRVGARPLLIATPLNGTSTTVSLVDPDGRVTPVTTIRRVETCQANRDVLVCNHGAGPYRPSTPDAAYAWLSVFRLPAYSR